MLNKIFHFFDIYVYIARHETVLLRNREIKAEQKVVFFETLFKSVVMQIQKAQINHRSRVSKVS